MIGWASYRDNAIPFFRESTFTTARLENNLPCGRVGLRVVLVRFSLRLPDYWRIIGDRP